MTTKDGKKIGIATLIMMVSVFLSRVIGLLREMVIAYIGGAGGEVDAYQVAFIIPEILNHILASGFLSVTFIPIFSQYLIRDQEEEGWKVFSGVLSVFGCLMIILVAGFFVFSPQLIHLMAPGMKDPELIENAVRMTRIIMPAQVFFFAGGLFSAVQFSKEKFAFPALAPLVYNVGIISGGLFLGPILGMEGFAWGVLGGSFFGNFILQYWGAKNAGMKFKFRFDPTHPDLRQYVLLTLPLMLGLTMTFSTEIFMKFFGSFLEKGSIAGLNYGMRIIFILVGLFGQAVGVASFPFLAKLAAENKMGDMNDLLNRTLKLLAVVIPISVLFMVLRHEIVMLLFQRGKFDATATALTSEILVYLLVGAYAFSAQTIVVRGFYALQNTLFPAIFGTLAVLLSIPLYWAGITFFGVMGVALAISFSVMIQISVLYSVWNRKTDNQGAKSVYSFIFRMVMLSITLGIALEGIKIFLAKNIDATTPTGGILLSCIIGLFFAVLMLSAGYALKIQEIQYLTNRLISFCKGKAHKFLAKAR